MVYKGIHLALEVKTFLDNLHLRWVLVKSPTLRGMDLPLITAIGIARRERGIIYTQEINKQSWSDYTQQARCY
jgi:hypothetical protein